MFSAWGRQAPSKAPKNSFLEEFLGIHEKQHNSMEFMAFQGILVNFCIPASHGAETPILPYENQRFVRCPDCLKGMNFKNLQEFL
jgi:hypothetical protein